MSFYLQLFISLLKKGHWLDACKEPGSTCSKQTTEPDGYGDGVEKAAKTFICLKLTPL